MKFVGVIAFDGGGNKLESRYTNPASFAAISEWFQAVIEYHGGELKYNANCEWHEISVHIYVDGPELYTVKAKPIESRVMRSLYRP